MTWTKISDNFAEQCADLSDAAFRTHVEGLIWAMKRESGGMMTKRDVDRLAESEHAHEAVAELVERRFWTQLDNGYRIEHHMEHQPEPDVIAARRSLDAERQRRARRKKVGLDSTPSRRDVTRDETRDHPRDPGRVGSGRNGRPNTSLEEKNSALTSEEQDEYEAHMTSWTSGARTETDDIDTAALDLLEREPEATPIDANTWRQLATGYDN
jgi:hypothetical protein